MRIKYVFGSAAFLKIYLDNAATTAPYSEITGLFSEYMSCWFNPSGMYHDALKAEKRMNAARAAVSACINAAPENTVFTSGGTEGSNTVALKGFRRMGGKKLAFVTSEYEHACVYNSFKALAEAGHDVAFVSPRKDGHIHPEDIAEAVCDNTALVSIMHVNNETGAVNDVEKICRAVKSKNPQTLFHSDGVQAYLKVPFDFALSALDYYTVSAHKIHGLKGTGAIFCKKNSPLRPLINGGGQENGLRSGTENTLGIFAFAEAAAIYSKNFSEHAEKMYSLRKRALENLSALNGFVMLSPEKDFAPHILNFAFEGMRGEVLLHLLEEDGICVATGAACSSKRGRSFRIHKHTGYKNDILEGAVRMSFCPFNTGEEIDIACEKTEDALKRFGRFKRR